MTRAYNYRNLTIRWLGHDGFLLTIPDCTVCIDPFRTATGTPADILLITHEHFDHLSIEDCRKFIGKSTKIICPESCRPALEPHGEVIVVEPGDAINVGTTHIRVLPAYNTNKYRDAAKNIVFHPREDGKAGYLLTMGKTTVYHAGDTDFTPEVSSVRCDIALLPVSGTYVMTAEEAAQAARAIVPKVAIPMHYGSIVGSVEDANKFKELLKDSPISVEILEP
jgi:L-ascorbate metabolism protein UlaG (beta-lactamase superfamily)